MAYEPAKEVLELLLASQAEHRPMAGGPAEARTALLMGVLTHAETNSEGRVAFDTQSVDTPVIARTIIPLTGHDVGRQVCLLFEQGDLTKPVILGFLQTRMNQASENVVGQNGDRSRPIEARLDGERIVIEGHKEIVLKCGKASITLTQDGRVLVRGPICRVGPQAPTSSRVGQCSSIRQS